MGEPVLNQALVRGLVWRCRQRPAPGVLHITAAECLALAEHAVLACRYHTTSVAELADEIRAGRMRFYNIPVRVD